MPRRFLVLQSLALWQGGFLFYAAFVVPIGADVLGSATVQGAISQRVAWWFNACGAAWAVFALADGLADGRAARWRLRIWGVAVVALAGQWLLLPALGERFDPELLRVTDRPTFRRLHGAYLWLATIDWLAGLAFLWRALVDWTRPEKLP